jgi:hypothetical protein
MIHHLHVSLISCRGANCSKPTADQGPIINLTHKSARALGIMVRGGQQTPLSSDMQSLVVIEEFKASKM